MTRFDEYKNRWPGNIRMERSADGILQMDFHSDGGPLVWTGTVHTDFPDAFWEVGRDDRDDEIRRLQAKVGAITMDNELLLERAHQLEAGLPLASRRSRR